MKCPKCGYNSFEYQNICKKCSADFGAYKQTYNIAPIVLPLEARVKKSDELQKVLSAGESPVENVEIHDDMFAFAPSEDEAPPPPQSSAASLNDDPFNFADDSPKDAPQQVKVQDGGFSDLLESTSQVADDPFADMLESNSQTANDPFALSAPPAPSATPVPSALPDPFAAPAPDPFAPAAGAAASTSVPGEFDLESFSWDDTATTTATGDGQTTANDFDTLFGGTSDSAKK